MTATYKPCGWKNPDGALFPLASFNPERPTQYDRHKGDWKQVFELVEAAPAVLNPAALADALKFGAGLNDLAPEQSSEAL